MRLEGLGGHMFRDALLHNAPRHEDGIYLTLCKVYLQLMSRRMRLKLVRIISSSGCDWLRLRVVA